MYAIDDIIRAKRCINLGPTLTIVVDKGNLSLTIIHLLINRDK
jgi:hypothetical protein